MKKIDRGKNYNTVPASKSMVSGEHKRSSASPVTWKAPEQCELG